MMNLGAYNGPHPSVERQRAVQRGVNALGGLLLLLATVAFGGLLARPILPAVPLLEIAICAAVIGLGVICRQPVLSVYFLVFTAIFLEQWGITGLAPLTAQTHIFETLSGFTPIPIPISPVELIMLLTLGVILLPALAKQGRPVVGGPLLVPLLIFLAAVTLSLAYGFAKGPAGTAFNGKAAWTEARSFFYMGFAYLLTCNLLTDRKRLHTFVWCIILALGLKGVEGIQRYLYQKQNGLALEALTGHEDVLFFATFYLLMAGMLVYGRHRQQLTALYWFFLPLTFTLLATKRRIGFICLAVGFVVFALAMLQTRRQLFFRVVPVVMVLVVVYAGLFWNAPGTLGQPVRAFKSQFGQGSERDRLSNEWRELEKTNIALNIKSAPLTGLGFGRPYTFYVEQPTLEGSGFIYWHYITHNAILWVWMKMGTPGFIAFWYFFGAATIQGLLLFRRLADGYLQGLALLAASFTLMSLFFAYGDLGLTYARNMIYLGCVLGMLAALPALDRRRADAEADPAARARPAGGRPAIRGLRAGKRMDVSAI